MKAHPARCTSVRRRAELWRRLHPLCLFVQSRQLVSRWESNPPLSNGGKRLTHRVSAARRIVTMSSMACDPDTRPTRTTSRARRLPAHALRRISSTFSSRWRERTGGAATIEGALTQVEGNHCLVALACWRSSFFSSSNINQQKPAENEPKRMPYWNTGVPLRMCRVLNSAARY